MSHLTVTILLLGCLFSPPILRADSKTHVYFGTYTKDTASKGVYRSTLDLATGQLSEPMVALVAESNPSFLALHPTRPLLYGVYEIGDDPSRVETVWSAMINPDSGVIRAFGTPRSSGGEAACHVSVDPAGTTVLVANYTGGSISSFPVKEDGSLGARVSYFKHEGGSAPEGRQSASHAHSINVSPDGKWALVADLGLDQILVYKLDPDTGKLTPNDPPFIEAPKGGGPRHLSFDPSGKWVFSNNEISSSVTSYAFDPELGTLSPIATVSTLPKGFEGKNSTAECLVHPTGKFVYVSNRGHDSIAVFSIGEEDGRLTPVEIESTGGKTPRGFGIDPSGTYLVAANQNSDTVDVFKIDPKSGALEATGGSVAVPSPVCVRFYVSE